MLPDWDIIYVAQAYTYCIYVYRYIHVHMYIYIYICLSTGLHALVSIGHAGSCGESFEMKWPQGPSSAKVLNAPVAWGL